MIQDPTVRQFVRGLWSWIGDRWRPQPILFGFSGEWREIEANTNCGVGTTDLDFSEVPEDEIWILQRAHGNCWSRALTRIVVRIYDGASLYTIAWEESPAQYAPAEVVGPIVLVEGENLRYSFQGTQAGDDVYAYARGYKMSIAE